MTVRASLAATVPPATMVMVLPVGNWPGNAVVGARASWQFSVATPLTTTMLSVGRRVRNTVSPLLTEIVMLVEPLTLPPVQAPAWSKVEAVEPTSTPGNSVPATGAGVCEPVEGVFGAEPQPTAKPASAKTPHKAVKCFEREDTVF